MEESIVCVLINEKKNVKTNKTSNPLEQRISCIFFVQGFSRSHCRWCFVSEKQTELREKKYRRLFCVFFFCVYIYVCVFFFCKAIHRATLFIPKNSPGILTRTRRVLCRINLTRATQKLFKVIGVR